METVYSSGHDDRQQMKIFLDFTIHNKNGATFTNVLEPLGVIRAQIT